MIFASKAYIDANRELVVAYLAGLIAGIKANVADPTAVLPMLTDNYGKDTEIDLVYSEAGNPAYIALLDSAFTETNGLLSIDPAYLESEVYPSYEAAGETDLPPRVRAARRDARGRRPEAVKITAIDPIALGYRKSDPPMARNFAVVRVETDAGFVGWGEASTNWGHSYPTVFQAAVRDVCAAPLLGTDPTDVRGRVAPAARDAGRLPRLGGADQPGDRRRSRSPAGTSSVRRPACRCTGCSVRPTATLRLYGTGTTMFEETADYHAHYFDEALRPRLPGLQGATRAQRRRRRRHRRRRARARRARRVHRHRLVLVPRPAHGARGRRRRWRRSASASSRSRCRRCASTSWPG